MSNIYKVQNDKFKSIYISYNFTMQVNRNENSESAVLAAVLAKSCAKYKSQMEIEKHLNKLYGSNFDVNVEKLGDLYNIEFRMDIINKNFLPNKEDVLVKALEFMYNMIYLPDIKDSKFNNETVEREKEFIIERIRAKKDDKLMYAINKTEELLCENEAFGWYLYGDEDIVENISSAGLYKRYISMLENSCISVIISGNLSGYEDIENITEKVFGDKLNNGKNYKELIADTSKCNRNNKPDEISETQDTNQSVITFGLNISEKLPNDFYTFNVYNAILGATPSSKLFQNFREKESLAYTVRSRYYRYKSVIIIYAGIEKKNYEKAKEVLMKELKDIELGNISDEEFNASKQSIISDLMEWNDSKVALGKMILSSLISSKTADIKLEDMIRGISNVSKEDVIDAAKRVKVNKIYFLGGENDV